MKKITDLAVELCADTSHSEDGVSFDVQNFDNGIRKHVTHVKTAKAAKAVGKPVGVYCNVEVGSLIDAVDGVVDVLGTALFKFIEESGTCFTKLLVIGLGNNRFVADSLGPKVCEALRGSEKMATFSPSVSGITGIESVQAIQAISAMVKPSHVVVIDSLCCHEKERLGNNFQISSTGISPGSGVGRDNQKIDEGFLGVPVIALGVPLVIYMPSLHYVVPKTVDLIVSNCAELIAGGIMKFVHPRQ